MIPIPMVIRMRICIGHPRWERKRDATVIVNKGNPKAWWEIHDEERKRSQREQLAAQRASKLAEKRRLSFGDKVELESTFRKTSYPENTIHTGSDVDGSDNSEKISEQSSMTYPLAFTVDLESERKKEFAKKLEIGDSIRQFIPRHKRNLSLPKTGEVKQEPKADLGIEAGGLPSSKTPSRGIRDAQSKLENDQPTETVDDIEDNVSVNIHDPVPISANKFFIKSTVPVHFPVMSSKKQTCAIDDIAKMKDVNMIDQKCNNRLDLTISDKTDPTESNKVFRNKKVIAKSSTVDVGALLHERHDGFDTSDGENVSESGTYTIEDENSHDLNTARKQIEVVFGVDAENCKNILLSSPSVDDSGSKFMLSNNSFVHEWAAQVQQQHMKQVSNGQGNKWNALVSSSLKPESTSQRPRRKLPTPPSKTPYCLPPVSPKSKNSDKAKGVQKMGESTTKKTDSYLETECFLKDTESLVTAMQARMDIGQNDDGVSLSTYYDTNESGADSDMDTSVSYSFDTSASVDNGVTAKTHDNKLTKYSNKNMLPLVKSRSVGGFDSNNMRNRSHPHSASVLVRNRPVTVGQRPFIDDSSLLSDSSSDFGDRAKLTKPQSTIKTDIKKQSRPIWRNKLGYESDTGVVSKGFYDKKKFEVSSNKSYNSDTIPPVKRKPSLPTKIGEVKPNDAFNRVDGGRFSLRANKPVVSSNPKVPSSKPPKSNKGLAKLNRSNSSLSNKEVEFQNWKRRKEYDPMKAAAEGKKKEKKKQEVAERNEKNASEPDRLTQSLHVDKKHGVKSQVSPVTSNLTRSASFHGGSSAKAALIRPPAISDDDDSLSGEWSPILAAAIQSSSFQQIKSQYEHLKSSQGYSTVPVGNVGHGNQEAQASNYDTEYVDCNSYLKYLSGEENNYPSGSYLGSMRNRKKLEALDTLVISTIHSLSSKLCNGAHGVLDKLRAITLDDNLLVRMEGLMQQLHDFNGPHSNTHSSIVSPRCSSSSRELATTLRNLKKLEECFNVVNMSLSELQGETDS